MTEQPTYVSISLLTQLISSLLYALHGFLVATKFMRLKRNRDDIYEHAHLIRYLRIHGFVYWIVLIVTGFAVWSCPLYGHAFVFIQDGVILFLYALTPICVFMTQTIVSGLTVRIRNPVGADKHELGNMARKERDKWLLKLARALYTEIADPTTRGTIIRTASIGLTETEWRVVLTAAFPVVLLPTLNEHLSNLNLTALASDPYINGTHTDTLYLHVLNDGASGDGPSV
jgi:hypothetical protein